MLLGGAVTPIVIVALTRQIGWQGALLSISAPIMLVFATWAWYGRNTPEEHPAVTREELGEVTRQVATATPITWRRLAAIIANRNIVALSLSYLCMNYTFYLLTYWSFLYLVQVRHFTGIGSGIAGMVPWIGASVGAAAGGILCDRAVERLGWKSGYRLVPLISLPVVAAVLIVAISITTPWLAVVALAVAFAGVEVNEGAYWAATMRVARADTGAAAGVLNTGGNAGGILCQPVVALLSSGGNWQAAFATGAVLAIVAAVLWMFVDADPASRKAFYPVSDEMNTIAD